MMSNITAPFQNLFPSLSLYQYRKGLRYSPLFLFLLSGTVFYKNGKISVWVVFLVGLAIISIFYQRPSLFLIMATLLVRNGISYLVDFTLIRSFKFIGLLILAAFLFLNFVQFQHLEQNEARAQFVSKKVIIKLERYQKIESILAFSFGIFSLVVIGVLYVISRKILPLDKSITEVIYSLVDYILTFTIILSFSFGLAGWIGKYRHKVLSIIGCIASSILTIADITYVIW
jgi:hypothetical protein